MLRYTRAFARLGTTLVARMGVPNFACMGAPNLARIGVRDLARLGTPVIAVLWLATVAATPAAAVDTTPFPVPYLSAQFVGLSAPVYVTGDGTGENVYIVERGGKVKVAAAGSTAHSTFLDITSLTTTTSERGLLGLAFSPDYAADRTFYVFHTDLGGDIVVARYRRDPANPTLADPASRQVVLQIEHSANANHNGGWIDFGPDGYLYVAVGDGGGSGDPGRNAKNLGVLLGKMLRIDPEAGDPETYTVPADNPFVDTPGARPEIWAYGLRNPWRCSFDSTGRLFIGDVGQNGYEEIDVAEPGVGGQNYGWNVWEGNHPYPPTATPSKSGYTFPVTEIAHDIARSITGGYLYEGTKFPTMRGTYIFGDFINGKIWGLRKNGETWTRQLLLDSPYMISSFGTDDAGNLFLCSWTNGTVYSVGDANTYSTLLGGQDRFKTAVLAARWAHPDWTGVKHVVIASGDDRAAPDPLAASGLCWAYNAPLMLVSQNVTPPDVVTAMKEIAAANGPVTIHVVGGYTAVPQARIDALLAAAPGSVAERVQATGSRYDTAAAIARRMKQVRPADFDNRAFFANGADPAHFTDALAVAAVTRSSGAPVLLCGWNTVPTATMRAVTDLGLTDRWAVGGPAALDFSVLRKLGIEEHRHRLAGKDRYFTAAQIAYRAIQDHWVAPTYVGVASKLPDALAGGAAVGSRGGLLILTARDEVPQGTAIFFSEHEQDIETIMCFGREAAIGYNVRTYLAELKD